jgi:Caspase domain
MKSFLVSRLHVPDSHIKLLINGGATRTKILNAWKTHLVDNDLIRNGDAIVIFFAGHGSRVQAPDGWPSTHGVIETICPQDEGCKNQPDEFVHGLPDPVINMLQHWLAAVKGNNIIRIKFVYSSAQADSPYPDRRL